MRKIIGRMLLWFIEPAQAEVAENRAWGGGVFPKFHVDVPMPSIRQPIAPLREGMVRKGGQNPPPSQIRERPPAPPLFRPSRQR